VAGRCPRDAKAHSIVVKARAGSGDRNPGGGRGAPDGAIVREPEPRPFLSIILETQNVGECHINTRDPSKIPAKGFSRSGGHPGPTSPRGGGKRMQQYVGSLRNREASDIFLIVAILLLSYNVLNCSTAGLHPPPNTQNAQLPSWPSNAADFRIAIGILQGWGSTMTKTYAWGQNGRRSHDPGCMGSRDPVSEVPPWALRGGRGSPPGGARARRGPGRRPTG